MTSLLDFFFGVVAVSLVDASAPVVETKLGRVTGHLVQVPLLQEVYEFTGIPFAEPPVGERRFRKPVPKASWNATVLEATKPSPICFQPTSSNAFTNFTESYLVPGANMSEDCLYLNIWVPKKTLDSISSSTNNSSENLLPVYIFIHGGGFITGTTMLSLYNGSVLAAYSNIIVASVGYRLGSLGFTYFGSEEAPGNVGLWDQLEGMKWIYENVGAFGGDNNEITIGGESAGAMSVTHHLLSPYSRKYFQRAIIQSGTALSPHAVYSNETARAVTKLVSEQVAAGKCNNSYSVSDQLKCLRSVSAEEFPIADLTSMSKGYGFGAAPVVDGDFIPKDPMEMLLEGDYYDVPLLLGANRDEGSFFFTLSSEAEEILGRPEHHQNLNITHYGKLLEIAFNVLSSSPRPMDPLLFRAVQLQYWPTDHEGFPVGREIVHAAVQAAGDYGFACPTFTWAQITSMFSSQASSVFAYHFTHRSSLGMTPEWMGVVHGAELPYVFGEPLAPYGQNLAYNRDEKLLSKIVMTYWANFIRSGDPNVGADSDSENAPNLGIWPSYASDYCPRQFFEINVLTHILHFGDTTLCGLKVRTCLFWDDFFRRLSETVNDKQHA